MKAEDLYDAIQSQNLGCVRDILEERPSDIEENDEGGIPFSLLAAKTGNLDLMQYIVEYSRASMDIRDTRNRNVLHYAAYSGNVNLVTYLVERVGMSPLSGDVNRVTPFDIAESKGYEDITDYFEKVCGAPLSGMYRNPVRTGMFPDPSIVRVEDSYYMVNSSFIFFPCIPVSHSKDLIHWSIIGYAIDNCEWSELRELDGGRGYWAADISYHKGHFYIAATYRMNDGGAICRRQMVTWSDRPEGPYSKPVFIDEDGIDPSLFWEEDGRCFMLLNRGGRIFELSEDASRKISDVSLLYYGDQKRAPEGPHLLKWNGYYYLFLAEGGTGMGHRITVSRSRMLMGTYEPCPYNPIMRQQDDRAKIQRCGHGKPVMTQNGEWYMVYLCGRLLEGQYTMLGRETALDPITWTSDGWPLVNLLKGPSVLQVRPRLPLQKTDLKMRDDFDSDKLGLSWMFPREPEPDGYRVRGDCLWIKGSESSLDLKSARGIVLRRQTGFSFAVETCIDFEKMEVLRAGQEVGLACYYDENTWLKFGVSCDCPGIFDLILSEHEGEIDRHKVQEDPEVQVPKCFTKIYLKIETAGKKRAFFWRTEDTAWILYHILENVNYLCDEGVHIGKRFTGAMTGMYAYAGQKPLIAAFDYFEYRDKEEEFMW